jgi:hypothetical protein
MFTFYMVVAYFVSYSNTSVNFTTLREAQNL